MAVVLPHARFRFYGSPQNYGKAAQAFLSGSIDRGDDVAALERDVERAVGGHALCTAQGRVALYLAVRALIRPGQKVIMSPYTIYDVVNMVICAGGVPLFADIDPDTCNLSAKEVEALIGGPDVGAVIVTHLHGLASDVDAIAGLCRARGVALIEDAAQAFGARVGGRRVGGIGDVGVFSFGRVKNVNAFFGGMAVARDPAVRDRMAAEARDWTPEPKTRLLKRILSCLGTEAVMSAPLFQAFTFWVLRSACLHDIQSVNKLVQTESHATRREALPERYRRRMTAMQARIVRSQLPKVDANSEARIRAARAYHAGLRDIPEIQLPPLREDGSHIYLAYPIQVDDRWALVKHLMRHGRDVSIQHIGNVENLPFFAEFARQCANATRTSERVVLLPTYPGFSDAQVAATITAVRSFYRPA
jgi:dTDP-4-amino-4,6-dideoxygalactose transaminase